MTTSIRYGSYTAAQAVAVVDPIQRSELALEAVKIISPAIAANASANIYTIKSPGKIHAVLSVELSTAAGGKKFSDNQAHTPLVTITADGKNINIACIAGGTTMANTDIVCLILAVGY